MTTLRSHTRYEIALALEEGLMVWFLDSGNDGYDDVLIGTEEEVWTDVFSHHEISEVPEGWSLSQITSISELREA